MKDLKRMTMEELETEMTALSEKKFRAKQIFSWLHKEKACAFSEMTNLSKKLREDLENTYVLPVLQVVEKQTSRIDGTRKYLLRLPDGNIIESVLMKYEYGFSLCVSTEVGCPMKCTFCASTVKGLIRRLQASEILEEVYAIERESGETVSHVVLMGSGEPFDNFEEVVRFIELLSDPNGKNLSKRNITLSTCGIPEKIKEFAELKYPVTLALSLHASTDAKRQELMPIAKRYGLKEILKACDFYLKKTGRRVTYEYAVVKGKNDTEEDALSLSRLLHGKNAHVNLIPVNPIAESPYEKPGMETVCGFQKILEKNTINATIRRSLGPDISGACGQLRNHYLEEKTKGI